MWVGWLLLFSFSFSFSVTFLFFEFENFLTEKNKKHLTINISNTHFRINTQHKSNQIKSNLPHNKVKFPPIKMVLAELGKKISSALRGLNKTTIDEATLKKLLSEIGRALFEADVSIHIVKEIRDNIKNIVSLEELAVGTNKQKMIQEAVFKELVRMINPEKTVSYLNNPYKITLHNTN